MALALGEVRRYVGFADMPPLPITRVCEAPRAPVVQMEEYDSMVKKLMVELLTVTDTVTDELRQLFRYLHLLRHSLPWSLLDASSSATLLNAA